MPLNGEGDLADGNPWFSMPLSWNELTIPIRVTFLAFGLSTNVRLTLLISRSLVLSYLWCYMHEVCSESWLIARVWL